MHIFSEQKMLDVPLKDAFQLVLDVEAYPEFLPHIESVYLISKTEKTMLADMNVKFAGMKQCYTSEIEFAISGEDAYINVYSDKGIFKHLKNEWYFDQRGESTLVKFKIEFEFSSKILNMVAGPVFDSVSKQMIDAFQKRAIEQYGNNKIS